MGYERRPTNLKTSRFTWRISSSLSNGGKDNDGNRRYADEGTKITNCVTKRSGKQGRGWCMTRTVQQTCQKGIIRPKCQ